MPDQVKEEEIQEEEVKPEKKGFLQKAKDAILPDQEEQAAIISTFVRLGELIWSGEIDPTFIASVFTGVLASFGIQTASKKGDGTMKMQNGSGAVSKADMEKLIEKATQTAPAQTIRIEQAPLQLTAQAPKKEEPPFKM